MPLMKEYKTVSIKTDQGWGGAKGTADTEAIDRVLNLMSTEGWELFCVQDLQHTNGLMLATEALLRWSWAVFAANFFWTLANHQ